MSSPHSPERKGRKPWSALFETGQGERLYPYLMVLPAFVLVMVVVVYPVISGIAAAARSVPVTRV